MSADKEIDIEDQIEEAPLRGLSDSEEVSVEDRARMYGWKPEEEFQGKGEWTDAETFLKRQEEDAKEALKANRNIERRYEKLEKTVDAIYAHQQRQIEAAKEQGYKEGLNAYNEKIKQAASEGDAETTDKLVQERDKYIKSQSEDVYSEQDHAFAEDWKSKNDWYGSDPVLSDAAVAICNAEAQKGSSVQQQLEAAEKYVRETWPHKFRQAKTPPVMPGNGSGVRMDRASKIGTYDALIPEMKAECDRFVRDQEGRGKAKDEAEKEFLKFATQDMYVEGAK